MKTIFRLTGPSAFVLALLISASSASAQAKPIWRDPIVASYPPQAEKATLAIQSITVVFATSSAQASSTCPVVTGFMKLDARNKPEEVRKLQAFLRGQGFAAEVSGIFDSKTKTAVEGFQRKYMAEIMAPWGATRPSGIVHVTTAKKINQIACGTGLTLSAGELAAVQSYASATLAAAAQQEAENAGPTIVLGPAKANASSSANTAAAGDASLMSRFVQFLKQLLAR